MKICKAPEMRGHMGTIWGHRGRKGFMGGHTREQISNHLNLIARGVGGEGPTS